MLKGKLIVIEGTDCSGKATQTNLLVKRLKKDNIKIEAFSFPNYDSPTGKIIGSNLLGKEDMGECLFLEGIVNVDPLVSGLIYAADRRYNIIKIKELLEKGINVLLNRYVYSNMAHQTGKPKTFEERNKIYEWVEKLEFDLLELPIPNIKIFLHMPYEGLYTLMKNRIEKPDKFESDEEYLRIAEEAYKEVALKYNFKTIECMKDNQIKTINSINEELYNYIIGGLNDKSV